MHELGLGDREEKERTLKSLRAELLLKSETLVKVAKDHLI